MRKKINWFLCFTLLLFASSCYNSVVEDANTSKNDLTNSNEGLTSQLRQIYSGPAVDARNSMFNSQESEDTCFQFIYPISFILPDGSEITINLEEDWDKLDLWYEENKDSENGPEIKYPFSISLDGSTFYVNNDFDFLELIYLIITVCGDIEGDFDEECFEFVYPISFILPDGSEITINLEEDWDKLDLWYEENEDSDEEPEIVYPFDVILDDDEVITITDDEDLEDLEEYCHEKDFDEDFDEECFEFVYPVSFILPDGSEITINLEEDWDKLDLWYEENEDSDEEPEIVYPFDVILDDDEVITITDDEDLEDLEEYCHEKDFDEDFDEECFEFVYPVSFILPDGSEITINLEEDWDKLDLWYEENEDSDEEPEIVYPFDVILDDDEVITITDDEDLEDLKDYCD